MGIKSIFALGIFVLVSNTIYGNVLEDKVNYILSDEFIETTNKLANGMWVAERSFHPKTSKRYLLGLLGVHPDNHLHMPPRRPNNYYLEEELADFPTNFDPRKNWPQCPSISKILNQAGCGSCWAFGAAGAMSDRLCIHSPNNEVKVDVSPENLLCCCHLCGFGCGGGYLAPAWNYWKRQGIVTGGGYGSHEGCQSYYIGPDDFCYDLKCTPRCIR